MALAKTCGMTPPTRDITDISLFDTAHINEEDEKGDPLYDKNDVIKTVQLFKTYEYRKPFNIGPFEVIFRDAGHIIGSAQIEVVDNSSTKYKKIVFSGDLGNSPQELIMPTEKIESAEFVVIETTYGDRAHPPEIIHDLLAFEINEVEKTGGTLLIPSFSIERSQEIVHRLSHLASEGTIDSTTQLFFDSPMGERVTEVFESYAEYFNKELSNDIKTYDPFHFPGMQYVKNSRESRMISELKGAKIIIAGSGMMTGGRIIGHAKKFLPLSDTRLLFVGYQAEDTLGRKILEGAKIVTIDREAGSNKRQCKPTTLLEFTCRST
jgi:metallo-beta-lactamase family protein